MAQVDVNYDIEGSDVGYRWFARTGHKPLFAFGHGMSYTRFDYTALKVSRIKPLTVSFSVRNTGEKAGADVPQLYLADGAGQQPSKRLLGWKKVLLQPGESQRVEVTVDDRLLANYDSKAGSWTSVTGVRELMLAHSAADPSSVIKVKLEGGTFRDRSVMR